MTHQYMIFEQLITCLTELLVKNLMHKLCTKRSNVELIHCYIQCVDMHFCSLSGPLSGYIDIESIAISHFKPSCEKKDVSKSKIN